MLNVEEWRLGSVHQLKDSHGEDINLYNIMIEMRSALEQLYHAKQMEFKPNLFWWIVSVVLLSPQLGVHLKLDVLHAIGQMLLTSNFNPTWK